MDSISATEARRLLYNLIDQVCDSHEPVQITGKRGSAMLVAEQDWRTIQEMLHLCSVPGMRESIAEGISIPIDDCAKELDW